LRQALNACDETPPLFYLRLNYIGKYKYTTACGGFMTLLVKLIFIYLATAKFFVMHNKEATQYSILTTNDDR
jgi:hypothetical protein